MFPSSDHFKLFNLYFIAILSFRALKQGATHVYWIILNFIHHVIENAPPFRQKAHMFTVSRLVSTCVISDIVNNKHKYIDVIQQILTI